MSNVTPVEKIRLYVARQLGELGANDVSDVSEAILIRSGLFCGRKFQCEGYEVVWFHEEDQIKFFAPGGDLLLNSSTTAVMQAYDDAVQAQPQRRAA